MSRLFRRLRLFRRQEDGVIMTEFLLLLPILTWVFMALVIYWDAFRAINSAQKASYAVSDLVSRQSDDIDMNFLRGMEKVLDYLTSSNGDVALRVTSIQWNERLGEYTLIFSESPNDRQPQLTEEDINSPAFLAKLPIMANLDTVVLVETWTQYRPAFDVGIPISRFENFIITRPRLRRVCLAGVPCPGV